MANRVFCCHGFDACSVVLTCKEYRAAVTVFLELIISVIVENNDNSSLYYNLHAKSAL